MAKEEAKIVFTCFLMVGKGYVVLVVVRILPLVYTTMRK